MITNSTQLSYFRLINNGPAGFAFDFFYMVEGTQQYAYSRPIYPGNSITATLPNYSTNIKFRVFVFNPPYQLIPIYTATFNNAFTNRCYLTSGTIDVPNLLRIPCFNLGETPNNNCCCCCCCK